MKARLVPVYFAGRDADFDVQLARLKELLAEQVDFLEPVPLGNKLPAAEAAVFPQLLGEAYRRLDAIRAIQIPLLVATSEFGMVNMWDWEIVSYLRTEGINIVAPYRLAQTRKACQALGVKRELGQTKFLVYQDTPGEGMQGDIFKRFYWWEDECVQRMTDKFGIQLVKKSYAVMAAGAKEIADDEAHEVWKKWQLPTAGLSERQLLSAIKIYIAIRRELDKDANIRAVGINCLNESRFSDSTPCLAWSMLYEERRLIWGCEGDTMSMMTKYVLHNSLDAPIMMTNIYPFLMGQAALKHERIDSFPMVPDPENHILVAHCGYLGVVPTSFATEWAVKPKVLAIVDDNAIALDARLPEGPITLAKLHPTMQKWTVAEGELTGYAQYPESDCLTGGVIRIGDGQKLLDTVSSHHYLLMTGHHLADIKMVSKLFDLALEEI